MSFHRWCLICQVALVLISGQCTDFCSAQVYQSQPSYQNQYSVPAVQAYRSSQNSPVVLSSNRGVTIPWYQSLVKNREHDFGVVARASKQQHIFEFENTIGQELILTGVRTSCGCTKPAILTPTVKPGETGRIKAVLDTRSFHGAKGATLTVSVQKLGSVIEYGELQFAVKGKIRRDVVCNPGDVAFNDVLPSHDSTRNVRVSYAGNPQWKIVNVRSSSPNIAVSATEVSRNEKTRRIEYELQFKLDPSVPAGMINEFVTIETNDAKTTGMPIRVTGRVKPELEAAPIHLGILSQGKIVTKKWIVRGSGAFRVQQVKTNNPAIQFAESMGEKSVHILTYTLDTSQVGNIDDEISIVTTNSGQTATKVKFSAQIIPATTVSNKP
jgi:hypothetical protein